jgi:hypothetical protein
MEIYNQILEVVTAAKSDIEKFYASGNKAAGTRARKYMQDLKVLAQDLRIEIQNSKKPEE